MAVVYIGGCEVQRIFRLRVPVDVFCIVGWESFEYRYGCCVYRWWRGTAHVPTARARGYFALRVVHACVCMCMHICVCLYVCLCTHAHDRTRGLVGCQRLECVYDCFIYGWWTRHSACSDCAMQWMSFVW